MKLYYVFVFMTLALFIYLVYTIIIVTKKGEEDERRSEETGSESCRRISRPPPESEEALGDYPSLDNLRDKPWQN